MSVIDTINAIKTKVGNIFTSGQTKSWSAVYPWIQESINDTLDLVESISRTSAGIFDIGYINGQYNMYVDDDVTVAFHGASGTGWTIRLHNNTGDERYVTFYEGADGTAERVADGASWIAYTGSGAIGTTGAKRFSVVFSNYGGSDAPFAIVLDIHIYRKDSDEIGMSVARLR